MQWSAKVAREIAAACLDPLNPGPAYAPTFLQLFREWAAHEEALLGKDSDTVVAAKLGRTESSVSQHCQALGIPAWQCSALSN